MVVMTVPVTTGGKNRMILENTGVISRPISDAAITAPKTDWIPPPSSDDRHHRRDAGERDALDQGQLGTEERNAEGLEKGGQAAHKEAGGDQHADVLRRQSRPPGR